MSIRTTDGGSVSDAGAADRSDEESDAQPVEDESRASRVRQDSRDKAGGKATSADKTRNKRVAPNSLRASAGTRRVLRSPALTW